MNSVKEKEQDESNFVSINEMARTTFDPKNDKKVKQRTLLIDHIPQKGDLTIWEDRENEIIGFADKTFYKIFPKDLIKSFSLENDPSPDSRGSSFLEIQFHKKSRNMVVFVGECYCFDEYVPEIERVTQLEVSITK